MMLEICAYGDSIGVMRVKEALGIQWLQCERLQCRIEVERGPTLVWPTMRCSRVNHLPVVMSLSNVILHRNVSVRRNIMPVPMAIISGLHRPHRPRLRTQFTGASSHNRLRPISQEPALTTIFDQPLPLYL